MDFWKGNFDPFDFLTDIYWGLIPPDLNIIFNCQQLSFIEGGDVNYLKADKS